MDLQHYLSIETDNFALNLGEDFYYYQNRNKNTLVHFPTQQEIHNIHNIRNDQPITTQLHKLFNHIPTINTDTARTIIYGGKIIHTLEIKHNNNLIYQDFIYIKLPEFIYIKAVFNPHKNYKESINYPIVKNKIHICKYFNYIYENKLYINNEATTK